jgi:hypothetical protein
MNLPEEIKLEGGTKPKSMDDLGRDEWFDLMYEYGERSNEYQGHSLRRYYNDVWSKQ